MESSWHMPITHEISVTSKGVERVLAMAMSVELEHCVTYGISQQQCDTVIMVWRMELKMPRYLHLKVGWFISGYDMTSLSVFWLSLECCRREHKAFVRGWSHVEEERASFMKTHIYLYFSDNSMLWTRHMWSIKWRRMPVLFPWISILTWSQLGVDGKKTLSLEITCCQTSLP